MLMRNSNSGPWLRGWRNSISFGGADFWQHHGFNNKNVKTSKNVAFDLLNKIGYGPIVSLFNMAAKFLNGQNPIIFFTDILLLRVTLGVREYISNL